MTDSKSPSAANSQPSSQDAWTKSERGALELRIAELTGVAEHLTQTITISQRHAERLEKEVEDLRRMQQLSLADYKAQEELNAQKRQELHILTMELKKCESVIIGQQERIRATAETIEIGEKNSKQMVQALQAECHEKMRAIRQEFDSERERLNIELEVHTRETEVAIKQLREELAQTRKKEQRALEIEMHEGKKKAEDTIARILQEGRNKNEAFIKATEITALEVQRESEVAAKRLLVEANQKAAEIIRNAQVEAEEIRRRTHNDEINFLKEKNSGLAELKLMVAQAREDAKDIIAAAAEEAKELQARVEAENEAKIIAANQKISQARKVAEKETQDFIQKARAGLATEVKNQEARLAQLQKEVDQEVAIERNQANEEARQIVINARERAQAILDTAAHEKNYKLEEIKALEASTFESARQSAANITSDADKIAITLIEEARGRAANVEKTVEGLIAQAHVEANRIRGAAEAYFERIKRDLPDPAEWERELNKIRQDEQERLRSLIEPTVKNYLAAIDRAINEVFFSLPQKYQTHKVIQDFAEAIAHIQRKKNLINFTELLARSTQPSSQAPQGPIKGAS